MRVQCSILTTPMALNIPLGSSVLPFGCRVDCCLGPKAKRAKEGLDRFAPRIPRVSLSAWNEVEKGDTSIISQGFDQA